MLCMHITVRTKEGGGRSTGRQGGCGGRTTLPQGQKSAPSLPSGMDMTTLSHGPTNYFPNRSILIGTLLTFSTCGWG